jgi:glycosyltransferase involved in cell wall biosynthesis
MRVWRRRAPAIREARPLDLCSALPGKSWRTGAPPRRLGEELELLIGLIAPPWLPVPPRRYGGVEMVIDVLARGLMAAGHQVLLAAPAGSSCQVPQVDGLLTSEPGRMGHTVVEIPYTLSAYAALKGVDVVHDHTVAGPLCVKPPQGIPVITTNHGPFNADLNPIYAEMSRQGVAVVAISHHQASTARNVKIAAVIHHGIDVDSIPVGDGAGGYACTLGRMTPAKGIREAVLVAREAGVPLRIGAKMREPLERQYFDDCVRPLLSGDIEYLGEPTPEEKYQLLGGAFALLNPIQWPEPFGLVMIEALACGTPVIATRCGSAPEIIADGDTGFVRTELSALAEALHQAAELDRNRCREKAVGCFSTDRMVAEHLQLYCRLQQAKPQDRGGRFLADAVAAANPIAPDRITPDRVLPGPVLRRSEWTREGLG